MAVKKAKRKTPVKKPAAKKAMPKKAVKAPFKKRVTKKAVDGVRRKKNPVEHYLVCVGRGKKAEGYWTGSDVAAKKSFDTDIEKAHAFATPKTALSAAKKITGVPPNYDLYIVKK